MKKLFQRIAASRRNRALDVCAIVAASNGGIG